MYFGNKRKDSLFAWLVCLCGAGFFFFDFLVMTIEGTLKDEISSCFGLGSESMYVGWIAGFFHVGNFLFILVVMYCLDHYSVRKITLGALLGAVCSTVLMSVAPTVWLFGIARFLFGACHSFCFLCMSTLIGRWFSEGKRGQVTGVCIAVGISGILCCQFVAKGLFVRVGLSGTLGFFAGFGVVVLLMVWLCVYDFPEDGDVVVVEGGVLMFLKMAMKNGKNWLYACYAGFMNAPYMVLLIYVVPFLQHVHGFGEQATGLPLYLTVGYIAGAPIIGFMSGWYGSGRMMIGGSVVTFLLLVGLFYVPSAYLLTSCVLIKGMLFLLGVAIIAQILSYPAIALENPGYMGASAMSIASLVVMGSISLFQTATSLLLDFRRPIGVDATKYVYSAGDYIVAFSPFLVAVLLSCVIAVYVYWKEGSHRNGVGVD